jgi:hypothetical protein
VPRALSTVVSHDVHEVDVRERLGGYAATAVLIRAASDDEQLALRLQLGVEKVFGMGVTDFGVNLTGAPISTINEIVA